MRVSAVHIGDVQRIGNRRRDCAGCGFSGFVRTSPVSFTHKTPKVSERIDVFLPKVYLLQDWRSTKGAVQVRCTRSLIVHPAT